MSQYNFDKIDRNRDWKKVFDQIDANFDKVVQYLESIGDRVKIESFTATKDQKVFQLSGEYNTKHNCLTVYKNGVRQWLNESFKETSSSSFTLVDSCEKGDKIVAVYNEFYLLGDSSPRGSVILESPDGSKFKVSVNDDGELMTTPM